MNPIPNPDDSRTILLAGQPVAIGSVRSTLRLLCWYRAFVRSSCVGARKPGDPFRSVISRPEAQRELTRLILVAINRKAGIPDVACRKQEPDYQRWLRHDARIINERFGKRSAHRRSMLNLAETRRRFGDRMFQDD